MKTLVFMAVMGLCSALPHQALAPFSSPSYDGGVQSTHSAGPLSAARNAFLDTYERQLAAGSHADSYDTAPVYDYTPAHKLIHVPHNSVHDHARSISTHQVSHARPSTVHVPAHNLVHNSPVHSFPHTQARTIVHAPIPAHTPRQIHTPAHYDVHTPTRDIYHERPHAVAHTPSHVPAHTVQHARAPTFAYKPITHHISNGPAHTPTSRPSYEQGTIHHDSRHGPSYSTVEPAHIVVSNGYVQDTPEVAAAKEDFFSLYNQQAAAAAAAPDDYDDYYNDEYGSH